MILIVDVDDYVVLKCDNPREVDVEMIFGYMHMHKLYHDDFGRPRKLYKVVDGKLVYDPVPLTTIEKLMPIRVERDRRLQVTDYIVSRHVEQARLVALGRLSQTTITDAKYVLVLLYRQQLRDLPATVDVDNPTYPTQPEV